MVNVHGHSIFWLKSCLEPFVTVLPSFFMTANDCCPTRRVYIARRRIDHPAIEPARSYELSSSPQASSNDLPRTCSS
jgi:hypothetical protein